MSYYRLARQQWRARIETGGCVHERYAFPWLARQQWRARIETWTWQWSATLHAGSPASNGGRGLKP